MERLLNSKQTFTGFLTMMVLMLAYGLYAHTFGGLTDFPQLEPDEQVPLEFTQSVSPVVRESEIAALRGFGPNCDELKAPLILESRKRTGPDVVPGRGVGLFVYATDYEILKVDGTPKRIRLHPFSLVYITRTGEGTQETDEISTVRGEEAILEFDRPIEMTKLSGVKPIAGWVRGKVNLKSNRRTKDPRDDIILLTEKLLYSEERNKIWADDAIRLIDKEATVTGVGMEVELYPKGPEVEGKRKSEAKKISIFRNVRFDLLVDQDSGFLAPGPVAKSEPGEEKEEKPPTPVTVTARGPFTFDLETNLARFQKSVQVLRRSPAKEGREGEYFDQLECDELALQFKKKVNEGDEEPTPEVEEENVANKDRGKRQLELKTTVATGEHVILLSDSQNLQATGNYLYYDAESKQAVLRGAKEMIAIHENAEIHARSLIIEQGEDSGGETKGIRNLIADGPNGWLEIADPKDRQAGKSQLRVRWKGRLNLVSKPGTERRLVTITDSVELEDERNALTSDKLKIWLVPVPVHDEDEEEDSKPDGKLLAQGEEPKKKRPRRRLQPVKLEATGNVSSHSDDMTVLTESLGMDIVHRAPARTEKKSQAPKEPTEAPAKKVARGPASKPKANEESKPIPREEPKRKQEPLDVRAKRVVLIVEQAGNRTTPISAWAEGDVLVTQTPTDADKDAFEIRGQVLQFERKAEGDIVEVGGSNKRLAFIKSTELTLAANQKINLDETRNRVQVTGRGYLTIVNDNDLTGKKRDRPGVVRVDWDRSMDFDGKLATFEGSVVAHQDTAEIHCAIMDVAFDQRLNFRALRENKNRKKTKYRIETIDCDKDVIVYDGQRQGNLVTRYVTLRSRELHYDNLFHQAIATGPGDVQVVERRPPRDKAGKPQSPFLMTWVSFTGEMRANNENKTSKFFDDIHIVHAPIGQLDERINPNELPPGSMMVEAADSAEMGQWEDDDGKKFRDFRAEGNVRVEARGEYWGQCDRLSYSEQLDRLVFASVQRHKAQFYRQMRVGEKPVEFRAREIKFWRTSGKISTTGSDGFHGFDISPNSTGGRNSTEARAREKAPR
ncbi:hypothetical protein Pan216_35310 [Planctomycetes bacterium Pan216]|uniref:OstA-like protein n=1 Tax=Kolteria novifilia TaxID=2527975 RepID=A0A518B6R6_9BACT|nr:hypothetical protein Pan216_35310 [Planctomycetes bacterium Pan216]